MNNNLVLIFLSCFLLSCNAGAGDSECTDCGGDLLDGYLYKEVTVEDVASLAEIDVTANVGKCIRFKSMDQNSLKQQLWMTAAALNTSKWF